MITFMRYDTRISYFDSTTASTITTATVHSKLDYCNSLSHPLQVFDHPAPTVAVVIVEAVVEPKYEIQS